MSDAMLADRIRAVRRHGAPITGEQQAAALALLEDMLAAAARHGITADDLGLFCDPPGIAVNLVLSKQRCPNN
jgi:hypothetical protein